jgi:hypothetical protein
VAEGGEVVHQRLLRHVGRHPADVDLSARGRGALFP